MALFPRPPARNLQPALARLVSAVLLVVSLLLVAWNPVAADTNRIESRSDLINRQVGGQNLALDAYLPMAASPDGTPVSTTARSVVVVIHGGGWVGGDKADEHREYISRALARDGFVVISVNYRLAPDHVFPAAIDDVKAAIAWLRQPAQVASLGIDPARIGVLGDSSGAQLASLLGSIGSGPLDRGSRVAAVVSLAGPMSFTSDLAEAGGANSVLMFLGCAEALPCPNRKDASPITYVDPSDPPYLLVNGADDPVVRPAQSVLMGKALDQAGVANEVLIPPIAAHGSDLFHDAGVARATIAFLHRYLDTAS